MAQSLAAGRRVTLAKVDGFADGVAVKTVGEEARFRLLFDEVYRLRVSALTRVSHTAVLPHRHGHRRRHRPRGHRHGPASSCFQSHILSSLCLPPCSDAICAAIKDVFEDTRSILEPAGALALAGAKAYLAHHNLQGEHVVAVTSGANMNFDRLRLVSELADVGLRTEAVLATTIPERAGAFKQFAATVAGAALDITEFKYRFSGDGAADAHVLYSVALRSPAQLEDLLARMRHAALPTVDLSANELAKVHIRHLVGGAAAVPHERLLKVEFPEKPGALVRFLDVLSPRWNITLFHYRNAGGNVAKVLVGLQVRPGERTAFDEALSAVGYDFQDETDNAAFRMFQTRQQAASGGGGDGAGWPKWPW